jgi:hypothetical protein
MARTPSLNNDYIRAPYEILLSLNLAFAFSYGITMYNLAQAVYSKGTSDGYLRGHPKPAIEGHLKTGQR